MSAIVANVVPSMAAQPSLESDSGMYTRQLQIGIQDLIEMPTGIERMAIGDESIVGVQILRTDIRNGARLLLTPLKLGHTSLMVWPIGGAAPQSYLLAVHPFREQTENTVHSLPALVAMQQPNDSDVGKTGQLQLKSNVVQVEVKIVEINNSRMQQAGLNIFSTRTNSHGFRFGMLSSGAMGGADFSGAGPLAPNASSPFAQAFGLLMDFSNAGVGLNLGVLESNGMAKVLAEPTLLAISGQSANFLAGGEIPIPISQGNGSVSLEYKTYGVGLTVSPTVLDNNRIVLKVAPESSELDYSNAVILQSTSVPAISTRRADTTVELGDGESFVIGGLVNQSVVSTVDRVPVLSEIPILGTLFKRQQFTRKDRELVIVVTPRLVKPITVDVDLDGHMPGGGRQVSQPASGFWQSYIGASSNALPGFSQ